MSIKTISLQVSCCGNTFTIGQQIANKSSIQDANQFKAAAQELIVIKNELEAENKIVKPKPKSKVGIKHTPKTKQNKTT